MTPVWLSDCSSDSKGKQQPQHKPAFPLYHASAGGHLGAGNTLMFLFITAPSVKAVSDQKNKNSNNNKKITIIPRLLQRGGGWKMLR